MALLEDGEVVGEVHLVSTEGHSRAVVPAIDVLLASRNRHPEELDGWAVCVGPGSYTGLRVGISTVQGLALGSGRPCVGITSLEALGLELRRGDRPVAPLLDAYRGQVFGAVYTADGKVLVEPRAETPELFLEKVPEGALVGGDGLDRFAEIVTRSRPDLVLSDRRPYLAPQIAWVAARALEEGRGVPPQELSPVYLRAPDIRKPRP